MAIKKIWVAAAITLAMSFAGFCEEEDNLGKWKVYVNSSDEFGTYYCETMDKSKFPKWAVTEDTVCVVKAFNEMDGRMYTIPFESKGVAENFIGTYSAVASGRKCNSWAITAGSIDELLRFYVKRYNGYPPMEENYYF